MDGSLSERDEALRGNEPREATARVAEGSVGRSRSESDFKGSDFK